MYSEKVKELVSNLPNRGSLPDHTHRAQGVNPICGDEVEFFFRVREGKVETSRFQARGCPAALAAAAAITELCQNRPLESCLQIDSRELLDYLQGLPRHKLHGVDLALEVLQRAFAKSGQL